MTTPFTLSDLEKAHEGVGAGGVCDYMQALSGMGVAYYVSHISDGHSDYFDGKGNRLSTGPIHRANPVACRPDPAAAKAALGAHGRGETDYFTFARQLAAAGVAAWVMDPKAMTCTFQCSAGKTLFVEPL